MRQALRNTVLTATAIFLAGAIGTAQAQDADQAVENGGIFIDGWTGQIDARAAEQGQVLENARLAAQPASGRSGGCRMTATNDSHRCDWCDRVLDPVVRHAQRHARSARGQD